MRISQLFYIFMAACIAVMMFGARIDAAPSHAGSVADVYARMASSMSSTGRVFHTVITTDTAQGGGGFHQRTETWIDLADGRAHSDVSTTFAGTNATSVHSGTWLVVGDAWFQTQEDEGTRQREAPKCHDAPSAALSVLLGCHSFYEESTTRVAADVSFEGRAAIALVTSGTDTGAGETSSFTDTLYVDPATYLPVALEGDGEIRHGPTIPVHSVMRYVNDAVAADSVAASFFDPASIGYRGVDVEAALHGLGFPVLWPGRDVQAPGGLPLLTLRQAAVHPAKMAQLLGYGATLAFGPAADEFAPPLVTIREWSGAAWSAYRAENRGEWWRGACVTVTSDANGSGVTVLAGYGDAELAQPAGGCPSSGPDRFAAVLEGGNVVSLIEARAGSVYGSAEVMRAIAAAMVPVAP